MSQIKKYFVSRWEEGFLLEADFSQLEIYVLAHIANDQQLKDDLLSGADLHAISAEMLYGKGFSPYQRKIAKQLSFQLQYGAGPKSMAERNQIDIAVAKKFINNYYARYKGVSYYHQHLIDKVAKNRQSSTYRTEKGFPAGTSVLVSNTGRRYTFIEQDAPAWTGKHTSFSPTQIKNYPVQGFATADIVPLSVGKIFRWLKNSEYNEKALLINTVHDSVVLDCCNEEVLTNVARHVKIIMQDVPRQLKERFNIDFDLPLKVGLEYGKNWLEMQKLESI